MNSDYSIIYNVFLMIKSALNSAISQKFAIFIEIMNYIVPSIIVIYVLIIGYRIQISQNLKASLLDLARLVVLVPFIFGSMFNHYVYKNIIIDPIIRLNMQISFAIANTPLNTDPFSKLDGAFKYFYSQIGSSSGIGALFTDTGTAIVGGLTLLLAIRLYFLVAKFLFVGIVWLYIAFMIGPIAITCLAFTQSRGVFFAWLKMLFTYFLYPIFAFLLMVIVQDVMFALGNHLATASSNKITSAIGAAVFLLIAAELINQIPNLSNALTGGNAQNSSAGEGSFSLANSFAGAAAGKATVGLKKQIASSTARMQQAITKALR